MRNYVNTKVGKWFGLRRIWSIKPEVPPYWSEDWYKIPGIHDKILQLSTEILQKYPLDKFRIFSLGQSPAWFVKGAEFLSSASAKDSFGYIAFSSGFLMKYGKSDQYVFINGEHGIPESRIVHHYREYLISIGMGVKEIIELWRDNNIQTVIADYIITGKGAASFMSILCMWAEELGVLEDLKKAVVLLNVTDGMYFLQKNLTEPGTASTFSMDTIEATLDMDLNAKYHIRNIVNVLANTQKAGDRLVAYYPPTKWKSDPIKDQNENTQGIVSDLKHAAMKYKKNFQSRRYT